MTDSTSSSLVRLPTRDVVNVQSMPPSIEAIAQILFEQLASYEIVNISRRDTITGQNPLYTLISNLSSIRRNVDPAQIISLQTPYQPDFEQYGIILDDKIPNDKYLTNNNLSSFYYIAENGDFVLELDNLNEDEEVEVRMLTNGKIT